MKFLGMELIVSPAVEPGCMLVRSGDLLYGWDLAKGTDTCVMARINKDGSLTVIDSYQSDAASEQGSRGTRQDTHNPTHSP